MENANQKSKLKILKWQFKKFIFDNHNGYFRIILL